MSIKIKNTIKNTIWVLLFALQSFSLLAEENPVNNIEEVKRLMQDFRAIVGASIYPMEERQIRSLAKNHQKTEPNNHLYPDDEECHNAIPLPEGIQKIPPYYSYVGKNRQHFIIPLEGNPLEYLEPGDIRIEFRRTPKTIEGLYDQATKGRWHASIVYKDEAGSLKHVDSPKGWTGTHRFTSTTYHVIRLRQDPPPGFTEETWKQKREEMLGKVQATLTQIMGTDYGYDGDRVSEVCLEGGCERVKEMLARGMCPKQYCSELPLTAYRLAGLPIPKAVSQEETFNFIEQKVLPKILAEEKNKKENANLTGEALRGKVLTRALDYLFEDRQMVNELGAERIRILRTEMETYFKTPPSLRAAYFNIYGNPFTESEKKRGRAVGPSDWFDQIFDKNGYFSYVGTRVGESFCPTAHDVSTNPSHVLSSPIHQLPISGLVLSPDGRTVITWSDDTKIKITDAATGVVLKEIEAQGDIIDSPMYAQFSPDGKYFGMIPYSWQQNVKARIFSVETGAVIRTIMLDEEFMEFSPDWKHFAKCKEINCNNVEIFELESGEKSAQIPIQLDSESGTYQFSPDWKYVVTLDDHTFKIFSLESGALIHTIQHQDVVKNAAFSPDGKYVVILGENAFKIFSLESGALIHTIQHQDVVKNAAFSPDGKYVVVLVDNDRTSKIIVKIFSLESGALIHTYEDTTLSKYDLRDARLDINGKYVVIRYIEGNIVFISIERGEVIQTIHSGSYVRIFQISPDGQWIYMNAGDGNLHIYAIKHIGEELISDLLHQYQAGPGSHRINYVTPEDENLRKYRLKRIEQVFKKARTRGMTRDQALTLLRTHINRVDYRGEVEGEERHLGGVIDLVFPPS
ncbi:MAG: hypothetical protein HY559_02615 [Gammaproteobacteria bacterium]|nr:hypothetical protein [Gammaproteobacteria bacterium]